MSQNRSNTDPFIEAERYDTMILTNLSDGMLPDNMTRNVINFGTGTTLNVKSVGAVTLQEVTAGTPMAYNAIDTGNVLLQINEYVGDAWSVSDELRQDGSQIDQLNGERAQESTKALQESFETTFLAACNDAQTVNDPNNINGFAHRVAASGANRQLAENDLVDMGLAFTKVNAPSAGRIGIVDPIVAATFDKLVTVTSNPDMSSAFYGMWSQSFVENHRFVARIHGWDLFTSNRLPTVGATDLGSAGDIANIFMCIADDNHKPMMRAWRKMPSTEGWRAPEDREDRFQVTSRYGVGAQRVDTLGVIITSPTASA